MPGNGKATAIIPAYNEEPTIADVVAVACRATLVDEVIVVDNGSVDRTAAIAEEAGARVVHHAEEGKGEAMAAGVASTSADVVVFLDGDLLGLRPDHVDALVREVNDGAGMACGLFDRGPVTNLIFLHALPILTGERALRRELFEELDRKELKGYKIEASLNSRCAERGLRVESFVCDGMWHRTKEEKSTNALTGFLRKMGMLVAATWSYANYWFRHKVAS